MVFDNFEKREREIEVREGRWEEVNFGLWRQKNVLRSTRGVKHFQPKEVMSMFGFCI